MTDFVPGLSVILITKNEGRRLDRCLSSVSFADEIIVLDGASDDNTVEVARAHRAKVVVDAAWPGFGPQKNRVLAMATREWVLSIDADEAVTDQLAESIRQTVAGATARGTGRSEEPVCGFVLSRLSCFAGRPLRFGDWASDRVLRLVRNGRARFSDVPVHEQLLCDGPTAALEGRLMHYTLDSMADARDKAHRYAQAAAPRVASRGKGGLVSACVHGGWAFIRGAFLRLGFLDGLYGFKLAWANAYGTWLRYRIAGRLRRGESVQG